MLLIFLQYDWYMIVDGKKLSSLIWIPAASSNLGISHLDHTVETGGDECTQHTAQCSGQTVHRTVHTAEWKWYHGVGTVETNASIPRIFRRHATLRYTCSSSNIPQIPKTAPHVVCTIHWTTPLRDCDCTAQTVNFSSVDASAEHRFPLIVKSRGEALPIRVMWEKRAQPTNFAKCSQPVAALIL